MTRPVRNNQPGAIHHLMNQGVDGNNVFLGDPDRFIFERLFGQLHHEHDVDILAYCLMGNHYHFIAEAGEDGISDGMQQLSSSFTRLVNERVGRVGPLFRGRFTSVTIESDEQLLATVAYVHRNPIDLVPAAALATYRWSSYGVYLGLRAAPTWLHTDLVAAMMPPEHHRRMVDDHIDAAPSVAVPATIIADALERVVPSDTQCRRTVGLVVSAGAGRCGTSELVRRFGFSTPAAARMALSRARQRCERSADLAGLVATVESTIATIGVTRGV